jgi:AcrR family transcriptional regulator
MDKALGLTNTQKKIIDAAIKVFSEKGFEWTGDYHIG